VGVPFASVFVCVCVCVCGRDHSEDRRRWEDDIKMYVRKEVAKVWTGSF